MKVFFKDSRDGAVGFKCKFFVWNVNDLCSPFRHLLGNVNKFCDKFNEVVRAPSVIVTRAEVHMDGSLSRSPSSTYDWDVSGSDVPDIEGSQAIMHSTPARDHNAARKRGINSCSEELPLLYKQRKETDLSLDVKIMEELKGACLGTARIPTAHLKLGVQLRELREAFIQELMGNMTEFPGHFYQPLCVIIDTLDDVSHFKESSASGYHYRVIGGCHNFTAAKRLATMYPAQDVFKTRLCTIYSNTLGEEAKLWLANRHNKIGEFRHSMTLKEKIQLCRNIFQAHVSRDDGRKWHDTVSAILCPSETKGMVKLIIKLATIEDNNYELLQEVLTLHSNGKLKGQNLSPADLIHGPSMKPYVLSPLPGLPSEAVNKMLTEVRDGTMTVGEMQKEAKVLNKLGTIQKMFLDLMTIKTWDEAVTRFPTATTRQVLEHFCQFNLRSTPSELKTFCAQLRKEENMLCEGSFKGEKGAIGHLLQCDVKSFDGDQVLQQVPAFTGAALIVLDVPEDWTWTDVKQFANTVTSMNLNESMDQFTVAIMSPVKEMAAVERAILETRHFSDPISLFCMVRNQTATDCKLLKDCVKGVTLATRGLDYNILWKGKHNRNYLEVDMDPSFRSDGLVVDPTQKPLDLYKELVVALTTPKQWVIDACSGTGTGCIAALSEGRNVVGLEIDEEMLRHSKLRISKELKPAEEELQGPEEIEVEGMQALNDSREGSIDDTDENIAD